MSAPALEQWDPVRALDDAGKSIVVFGHSGSGKTTLMKSILHVVRNKVEAATGFMGTADAVRDYRQCMPVAHVHAGFDEATLQEGVTKQVNAGISLGADGDDNRAPCWGVILDDCADAKVFKAGGIKYALMNGRSHNIFLLVGTQYVPSLSPDIRREFKLTIAFPPHPSVYTRLRESLFDCFTTDSELAAVFDTLEPREALVYDRRECAAGRPFLFRYKAEFPVATFRIGSKAYWESTPAKSEPEPKPKLPAMTTVSTVSVSTDPMPSCPLPGCNLVKVAAVVALLACSFALGTAVNLKWR